MQQILGMAFLATAGVMMVFMGFYGLAPSLFRHRAGRRHRPIKIKEVDGQDGTPRLAIEPTIAGQFERTAYDELLTEMVAMRSDLTELATAVQALRDQSAGHDAQPALRSAA